MKDYIHDDPWLYIGNVALSAQLALESPLLNHNMLICKGQPWQRPQHPQ